MTMHQPIDPALPLVLIGDSHSAALYQAAQMQGMACKMLYLSGNHWHENRIRAHRLRGLWAGYRPGLQQQIDAFAAGLGGSVFPQGAVVLASFGFHLGRLVPLLRRFGHAATLEQGKLFLTQGFLESFISHHRGQLHRALRHAHGQCRLVVMAPPVVQDDPLALHVTGLMVTMLRKQGLTVFSPQEEPDWQGRPLPASLRGADGVHGNAAYGAELLKRLQAKGLLPEVCTI